MDEGANYGWNIQTTRYSRGIFLLGVNFNTNNDFNNRESYVCIYLGKICITIGKFRKW